MPGKNFIRIPSIFMAIGGVISVVVYLIFGLFISYAAIDTQENMGWLIVVVALVYTIFALLQFIAAAKGIKNCNRREAAGDLKKWGMILIIVSLIAGAVNLISSTLQGESVVSGLVSVILGMVFPILYIYGASLNEKAQL